MRGLVAVVLVGCGFNPGQLAGGDATMLDVASDVSIDVPPRENCYAQWFDGTIRFDTPIELPNVNSAQFDRDPYLTADELQFFVSSGRQGGMGGTVWIAKRPSTMVAFSPPTVESTFESVGDETKLSITADGLYAVVGSNRDTPNSVDVWEASRAAITDPWSAVTRDHVMLVNSSSSEHDPTISADGLHLYFAGHSGTYQFIALASRGDRSANFGVPVELTELTSTMGDADPSPTPDERIILFGSNRPPPLAGPAAPNAWYATRASKNAPFSAPLIVPDINGDLSEGDPHLSADGCRIYFGRNLGGDNWNIFVATAAP